ncbi:MAG: TSUP family transporter [Candidatus Cloacimonadales bacterium]
MEMLHPYGMFIILPAIFLAGLIDSMAGGGGLISIPAYLAAGLPPHFALGNNKFSSANGTIFSTIRFFRNNLIDTKVALFSAVFALIGSFFGTKTVLYLSPNFLNILLIIALPVIAFIIIFNKKLGQVNNSSSVSMKKKLITAVIAGLAIGFYDGFFGPGTGSFLILIYTSVLHYDFVVANANAKVVNLASNLAAVATFIASGKVNYEIAIPAAICGILGNLTGSQLVIKKGNAFIKPVFVFVLMLLLVKVIWDQIA